MLASESVWRQLRHRPEFGFRARSRRTLKGLAAPERVFALRPAGGAGEAEGERVAGSAAAPVSAHLPSLWAELKRRSVFRVAAVYALVSWVTVQVAVATFPYLGLPEWLVTAVIVLALLGFPVALVLAWAFELTPRGVQRTEPRAAGSGAAEKTRAERHARKRAFALVGAGLARRVAQRLGAGSARCCTTTPRSLAADPPWPAKRWNVFWKSRRTISSVCITSSTLLRQSGVLRSWIRWWREHSNSIPRQNFL